jgi:serine/threonine-protein kinase
VAKATAVLGIAVAPWGEVYVNGRKMGVSPPLTELKLAPGKYVVEIRNTTFPAYRETIDLATQNSFRIRHKFQ